VTSTKAEKEAEGLGYDIAELDDVDPTKEPTRYFVKGEGNNKLVEVEGRRPSNQLCVTKLRDAVGEWRTSGYAGASETTKTLFRWWFLEGAGPGDRSFKPYFAQREAVETIVYLLEIQKGLSTKTLIKDFHQLIDTGLGLGEIDFNHVEGELRLDHPSIGQGIPLPAEDVRRYAVKAATGSGKTVIMALYIAWSYFHSTRESNSDQASNFLVVAPNVIVFERLKVDFANTAVFRELKLVPPGWSLDLRVLLRGDSLEPTGRGNLIVTNIQQLYDNRTTWKPKNAVERILGKAVVKGGADGRPMIDRVRSLQKLAVLNDEAHHVHEPELQWNQIITKLHDNLDGGLRSWLDFSATPRFGSGAYFPWVISDYPLAQAVEDRVVKVPILVRTKPEKPKEEKKKKVKAKITASDYSNWIRIGVERLKNHEKVSKGVPGAKPVMFIMCENVRHADDVGAFLLDKRHGFGFKENEVLVIHTKGQGEIRDSDLDELRRQSRLIDEQNSPIRVVVSVLILREGWDVRNITVVLGLRPANSKNEILPEQAIGRGLRLMKGVRGRQILEVIGTPSFEELLGGLEEEGVYVTSTDKPPVAVRIEPIDERKKFDISIPRTGPTIKRDTKDLGKMDPSKIPVAFSEKDITGSLARLRVDFLDIVSGRKVGTTTIDLGPPLLSGEVIASIVNKAIAMAKVTEQFAVLYPVVKKYLSEYAFGISIDLDVENVRRLLADPEYETPLVEVIASAIGQKVTKTTEIRLEPNPFKLSETESFIWRRQTAKAEKTIFNLMATYNNFESDFGKFLDKQADVLAFAALAEQFTKFNVSYLKPSGALGLYYPDWVVKQKFGKEIRYWIIETKGQVHDGVIQKDAAIVDWCKRVSEVGTEKWGYMRVDQSWWNGKTLSSFADVVVGVEKNQEDQGLTGLFFWPESE
jgi:type III restriction enzyme